MVWIASERVEVWIMDQDNAVTVIEKLAEICKDGEKGYKDAAEHSKRSDLKTFFITQSSERARFARELQSALAKLGRPEKKESGTVAGALHRAWIDTKVGLGAGDKSILESVEKGEDEAKEAYQEAIRASLPTDVAEIVSRQARSIQAAHDQVKTLRDGLAA
jgi:uncharacterized protein (TIGR02284 family)